MPTAEKAYRAVRSDYLARMLRFRFILDRKVMRLTIVAVTSLPLMM